MRFLAPAFFLVAACGPPPIGAKLSGLVLPQQTKLGRIAVAGSDKEVNIDAVESAIINEAKGKVTVLARNEQSLLNAEKQLQYSGDFSDESVCSLGKQLGAQYLFVAKGQTVELPKTRNTPKLATCADRFRPSNGDDAKERDTKRAQIENCERENSEAQKLADYDYAHQPIRHRYKLRVRVVDITQGIVVANADFVGDDGDFGDQCDFDCIRDRAARRAVRFLFTGSGIKEQQAQK